MPDQRNKKLELNPTGLPDSGIFVCAGQARRVVKSEVSGKVQQPKVVTRLFF